MKDLEIHLLYFKQGDDLSHCLESTKTNEEALEYHAEMLKNASEHLLQIRDIIKGHDVQIQAGTHYIGICGEDSVMDKLIELDLAEEMDYEDDCED